jgi:hypothetical protein
MEFDVKQKNSFGSRVLYLSFCSFLPTSVAIQVLRAFLSAMHLESMEFDVRTEKYHMRLFE